MTPHLCSKGSVVGQTGEGYGKPAKAMVRQTGEGYYFKVSRESKVGEMKRNTYYFDSFCTIPSECNQDLLKKCICVGLASR